MNKKRESINGVAFFNILGPIILNGINFFTIPIFTRMLGTEHYGLYTLYYTWVNLMVIFVSLQVAGTIPVSTIKIEEEARKKYYSSILFLNCISFVVWILVVTVGMPWVEKIVDFPRPIIYLIIIHAMTMGIVNFATTRYTNEKKTYYTFAISVLVAVSGIVLSLILLKFGNLTDKTLYLGRVYGAIIPYIFLGTVLLIIYLIQGKTFVSKNAWKFCLPLCLPMVFHGVSQLILAQADKVMLKEMTNASFVGVYGFTYSFAHIMNIIYGALNSTWVPFYFEDLKNNREKLIAKKTKNYIFIFTTLSMGFMLLAPDVIKLFAGEDFWTGISLVPMFVFANYMIFLYSFPVNYEFYHQKSIHIAIGTSGAALINCLLNYLFIPKMGMLGAALATFISYIILWIFHHMVAKYIIREGYQYKIKIFIPGIVMMLITAIMVNYTERLFVIRWIVAMVVGFVALRHLIKTKTIF